MRTDPTKDPSYTQLALLFLRIGTTSFGGSMLPLLEDTVVHRKRWLSEEALIEMIALAELVPGPVALKVTAYVGYVLRGKRGMGVAVFAFALPAILLVLAGSWWIFRNDHQLSFQKYFIFLTPIVVAAFLATATRMAMRSVKKPIQVALALFAFVSMSLNLSPIWILLLSGLVGALSTRQ